MVRWSGLSSAGVSARMLSIWAKLGLLLSLDLSRRTKLRLVGQRSEAEVCPTSPCVAHIFLQVERGMVCSVDKQVGQTRILEQASSPLR